MSEIALKNVCKMYDKVHCVVKVKKIDMHQNLGKGGISIGGVSLLALTTRIL